MTGLLLSEHGHSGLRWTFLVKWCTNWWIAHGKSKHIVVRLLFVHPAVWLAIVHDILLSIVHSYTCFITGVQLQWYLSILWKGYLLCAQSALGLWFTGWGWNFCRNSHIKLWPLHFCCEMVGLGVGRLKVLTHVTHLALCLCIWSFLPPVMLYIQLTTCWNGKFWCILTYLRILWSWFSFYVVFLV